MLYIARWARICSWLCVLCCGMVAVAAERDTSWSSEQRWLHERAAEGALKAFYQGRDFQPAWWRQGQWTAEAQQALAVLASAASHGLDEADYGLPRQAQADTEASRMEVELALTRALFHFLGDLHRGRVSARKLGAELDLVPKEPDVAALLRQALQASQVANLADQVAPSLPMYEKLRHALAHYRALAAKGKVPLVPEVKKLEPGQAYEGVASLRNRLILEGDLSPQSPVSNQYQGELVAAVKRFQGRHGLDADGVLGKASFRALNVPFAERVRQIELSMERLRWLRVPSSDKVIGVNIPEFRLRAMDVRGGQIETRFSMNVIVGKAVLDKRTPIFDEDMRSIDFRPYWNVPPSIIKKELLPKLRQHPGYVAEQDMELLPNGGGAAQSTVSDEALQALAQGQMRIRQRPGDKNPLGPIKFVLPNNHDVYLHYTSSPRLFQRARRDFSHGCIRVEEPLKLARFVLEDQADWSEERIQAAMSAEKSSSVRLSRPVPVVIFYSTVVVDNDGRVLFLPDIYELDGPLDRALHQHLNSAR